jgi:hypothetical protein
MKRREMIVLPHCKHHDRVAQTPALLLLYRGTRTRPKQHDERMNECCCPASHSPPSPFVVASCGSRVPPFVAWLPSQPTVSSGWRSPSPKGRKLLPQNNTTAGNVAKNAPPWAVFLRSHIGPAASLGAGPSLAVKGSAPTQISLKSTSLPIALKTP